MTDYGQVPADAASGDGPEVVSTDPAADPAAGLVDRLGVAAQRLTGLADQPVTEHVARYDTLHGELQAALAAIDSL